MENNGRKAEALAEKIKSLLEEGVTTGKIKREAVIIIRGLEKEILALGYSVDWLVSEWGVTIALTPKEIIYKPNATHTREQSAPHPTEQTNLTEEENAKFEKIMNELWRKDND